MGDWIQEYAVCETASKLVGPRNKYHQLAIWPDMQCVSLGKGGGSDSSKCFLCIAVNYIPSHHSHRRRLVRGIVSRPIEPKWVEFLQRFLQGVNQDLNSGSHYTFKIWVVDLPSSFAPGCRPVKTTICRLNVHPGEVSVWCWVLRCRAQLADQTTLQLAGVIIPDGVVWCGCGPLGFVCVHVCTCVYIR